MKVCPYCNAISEEPNAIKCSVCGRDISHEVEHSAQELSDQAVLDEIDYQNKKLRNKLRIKKALSFLILPAFLILIFIVVFFVEPSGHINITRNYYEMKVGERLVIPIEYSDKVNLKNVRINLDESLYKDLGTNEFSYYFDIVDDSYVLVAKKEDTLKFTFTVKDDGTQKNYNNKITVVILPED